MATHQNNNVEEFKLLEASNHYNVCKPASKTDERYLLAKDLIVSVLKE